MHSKVHSRLAAFEPKERQNYCMNIAFTFEREAIKVKLKYKYFTYEIMQLSCRALRAEASFCSQS